MKRYSAPHRKAIGEAWTNGGTLALGLLLTKIRPHFSVQDYGEAVRIAREETGDTTDYSDGRALLARQTADKAEKYRPTT
jgi:hypothetical protein